jgi:hypothetical protein
MTENLRSAAGAAFNAAWEYLDKPDRTEAETAQMLTLAHGSRHLWSDIGGPREWSIGDWQIARAYAAAGAGALARLYAQSALMHATDHAADPFIIAAAHEGLARACAVDHLPEAATHAATARRLAEALADAEDRDVILSDLRRYGSHGAQSD